MGIFLDEFDILELFLYESENILCKGGESGLVFKKRSGKEKLELTVFIELNIILVHIFWCESKLIDVKLTGVSKIEKREMYLIIYKGESVIASILLSDKIKISFDNQNMW